MLIEDHPEYREVVELTLSEESDLKLISQFGTAERALDQLQNLSSEAAPDTILLDLNLPGMSGIEAIRWILKYQPKIKIIILTQSENERDILEAIQHGAVGYLLKSSNIKTITNSIRQVIEGGAVIEPSMAKYLLTTLKMGSPQEPDLKINLSKREHEVLSLVAEGFSKKEIAQQLNIGSSTVVTHVNHIYEKLNAANAPAAINIAHKHGLL